MKKQKVNWGSLVETGFLFGAALVVEARLPFAPATDSSLLLLWMVFFYGAVALWISANRAALEHEPRPVDCLGQPIIGPSSLDSLENEETKDTTTPPQMPALLSRSKVM